MFGKYFRFELKNSYLLPTIMCCIILFNAFLCYISVPLNNNYLFTISTFSYSISFSASFFVLATTITKTFKNRLFSKTGYLTLTLPIDTNTLIITKVLVNIIYVLMFLASLVVSVFSYAEAILHGAFDINNTFLIEVISNYFKEFSEAPLAHIIKIIFLLISLVSFLLYVLFILSFCNTGRVKKYRNVLYLIFIVLGLIIIGVFLKLSIIPYSLYFNLDTSKFVLAEEDVINQMAGNFYSIGNLNNVLWNLIELFGFYFLTRYLIKNKLDIE